MKILGSSLTALEKAVSEKKLTSNDISAYFEKRVQAYGKKLNVFVTSPHETKSDGMPIAIKDNFCTDGTRTTACSKVLEEFVPPYDATVVARLKRAGYGVFGKTNLDAWAHGSSTETSDFGATLNPWDTERAPGGSSGGSAAAMAAYLAPATIGSETAGSIRLPAAWCGVVGLKPTYGRVSRYGVAAMGSSWDCPGPITWSVEDAARLLGIIAGHDPYDATSSAQETPDYSALLEGSAKKLTIGVSEEYFKGVDEGVRAKVEQAIEVLKKMGHTVVPVKLMSSDIAISVYTILQRSEVSSNLARYSGIRYGRDRTHFATEAKRRMLLGTYTLSHGYYDAYYKKAEKVRAMIVKDFEDAFQSVDCIVGPTAPIGAIKLGEFEKYPFFGELMDRLNEPAAAAGIPAISIPVGLDTQQLPVGMQIMGPRMSEGMLLSVAHQFEKETNFFDMRETMLKKYPDA